ncbi:MAG TPA: aminotransferase class V-fold PLP-dependent enzyme [Gemmatimonadaceae bacterium]|nr:aminotransferase class V-fold PLP-dependent enzyme [Gemmatimonadaceae bacterium]
MLSANRAGAGAPPAPATDDAWFTDWRQRELGRVERAGVTYLDYTGAALYPESLVRCDAARLATCLLGNPHSEHGPSRASTEDVNAARRAVLAFLRAASDEYVAILTPNATGACRLVAESFPFGTGSTLALAADNHNSVNGIREYARAAGATITTIPVDEELRLVRPEAVLDPVLRAPSLFAYAAQSNFSGVRHPLALIPEARARGWRVLLDAASYVPTADLRLDQVRPDFVALSLYKMTGYPAGIGALVARRDALAELRRPWFAGGTVRWASVQHGRHCLADAEAAFEDGTLPYLSAGAVAPALDALLAAGRDRLARHVRCLTSDTLRALQVLVHRTGVPLVAVHGPRTAEARGATIALTLRDPRGRVIPYWLVEASARAAGIAVRGGCFCNPGCAEAAFDFPDAGTRRCLDALGGDFTIPRFARCLGDDVPVGAIRVSFGLGSVGADVERLTEFLERFLNGGA